MILDTAKKGGYKSLIDILSLSLRTWKVIYWIKEGLINDIEP